MFLSTYIHTYMIPSVYLPMLGNELAQKLQLILGTRKCTACGVQITYVGCITYEANQAIKVYNPKQTIIQTVTSDSIEKQSNKFMPG